MDSSTTPLNQDNPNTGSSSSTPLEPPRTYPTQEIYSLGNMPPRTYSNYDNQKELIKYKNFGKKYPIEIYSEDTLLNINKYSPQLWPEVIQQWKNITIKKYLEKNFNHTAEQMYKNLETTLGNAVKRLWDDYKKQYPNEYRQLLTLGNNPYNFINTVSNLVTASDPNSGSVYQQAEAVRKLEQLKQNDPKYIVSFMEEFIFYTSKSQNNYNKDFMNKLLMKIPGPLGIQIQQAGKEFIEKGGNSYTNNIVTLAYFIMQYLEKKCTEIIIQRQMKSDYKFCDNIYTAQQYGTSKESCSCKKPKKTQKQISYKRRDDKFKRISSNKQYKKKPFIRKFSAKKPFLDKNIHVRRYYSQRTYKDAITCYTCGELGHLSTNCPNKHNIHNKQSKLINNINMDLIEITDNISDTETIYSIISEEVLTSDEEIDDNRFEPEDMVEAIMSSKSLNLDKQFMENIHRHSWDKRTGSDDVPCFKCYRYPNMALRAQCSTCFREICKYCWIKDYPSENWDKDDNLGEKIDKQEITSIKTRLVALEEWKILCELKELKKLEEENSSTSNITENSSEDKNNSAIKRENIALSEELVKFKKIIVDKENEIEMLKEKIEKMMEKTEGVSYSGVVQEKPATPIDFVLQKLAEIQASQEKTNNLIEESRSDLQRDIWNVSEDLKELYETPSIGWANWFYRNFEMPVDVRKEARFTIRAMDQERKMKMKEEGSPSNIQPGSPIIPNKNDPEIKTVQTTEKPSWYQMCIDDANLMVQELAREEQAQEAMQTSPARRV